MPHPTHTAVGAWSGGRFMHYGEQLDDQRLIDLLRPGNGIDTVVTADAYGAGEGDVLVGRAIAGLPREDYRLVGAIGHDFYKGLRQGAKGFPRFTDPQLRPESEFADYIRTATERSLERCGVDRFDLLLLHNPDRTGFTSSAVWEGMAAVREAGLTDLIGVAPGPANGYTLDVIDCLERFGAAIDWAMVILNPFEPWPGELVLPAAERHDVRLLTRVVDFGGIFHGDVRPGSRVRRARSPRLPAGGLGRAGQRATRQRATDRRAAGTDAAAARLSVEPRASGGPQRRADVDPGVRRRRAHDRVQAR